MNILKFAFVLTFAVVAPIRAADAVAPLGEALIYKRVGERELKLYLVQPDGWKTHDRRPADGFIHGCGWVGGTPSQINEQSR